MREGFVYILTNRKSGILYIGVTSDLAKRVEQHRTGSVPGFAKKYQCRRVAWFEVFDNIHDACIVERRMKAWKRDWKIELIERANPGWSDLGDRLV